MASLRNLAITILRLSGAICIAAALPLSRPPIQPIPADNHDVLIRLCRGPGDEPCRHTALAALAQFRATAISRRAIRLYGHTV
jgi:hypothetical protein